MVWRAWYGEAARFCVPPSSTTGWTVRVRICMPVLIGSTSKIFVALAVLKLVEQGKLSLDDTLADLAPDVAFENPWEETHPIRVVHLLEHTTGWDDIHLPEYAHNQPDPVSLKEGLDFHPHSRISRWRPGSRSWAWPF